MGLSQREGTNGHAADEGFVMAFQPLNDPRNDIATPTTVNADKTLVPFRQASTAPAEALGAVALDLVYWAAQLIRSIEDRSNDIGGRARTLVQRALQLAEARIRTAETERQSAIDEAAAKVQELEIALKQAQARFAEAEIRASAAELRAKVAEARASEGINAIARIEDAIRAQIFEPRRDTVSNLIAA